MTHSVSIRTCPSYEACEAEILAALSEAEMLHELENKRVLLKINMMKGSPPEAALTTHPVFVGALVRVLVQHGARVQVGDSSGILGFTDEAFQASGMADAVFAAGGRIVNFDRGPFERLASRHPRVSEYWVPRCILDAEAVLQVPKLKTHTLVGLTGAVKGLIGMLPGATKCALHVRLPEVDAFADGILDLYETLKRYGVRFAGAIYDGIEALAGRGPGVGDVFHKPGLILAGSDLFAVDRAAALCVGFGREDLPLMRRAEARGLDDPDALHWIGKTSGDVYHPFEKPSRAWSERTASVTRANYWVRQHSIRLRHDPARCAFLQNCFKVCPVNCLEVRRGRIVVGKNCIRCTACHAVCPTGAMRLEIQPGLRRIFENRAAGVDTGKRDGK